MALPKRLDCTYGIARFPGIEGEALVTDSNYHNGTVAGHVYVCSREEADLAPTEPLSASSPPFNGPAATGPGRHPGRRGVDGWATR